MSDVRYVQKVQKVFAGLLLVAVLAGGCGAPAGGRDVLYQTSTISALLAGVYDGELTVGELKARGDFGLGTFDALDGELVVLDGVVYQVRADGKVRVPPDSTRTPFAAVVRFAPDETMHLDARADVDLDKLQALLEKTLPSKNVPCAVRISGEFRYVKTRSVPRQSKPYPPLVDVVKKQPIFEFRNVRGTMVAFRLPAYMSGLNVPGWHLHFLTADRSGGGHVLAARPAKITMQIDHLDAVRLDLPRGGAFYKTDLTGQRAGDLDKVER